LPDSDRRAAVTPRSRLQVDAAEAIVEAALAGTGIIRLFSYHVASAVKDGRLSLNSNRRNCLVYLGGGLLPLKVRAFLDFAASRLKAWLAGIWRDESLVPRTQRSA
jgi:DNA-binding transcriptional LysR family regulator